MDSPIKNRRSQILILGDGRSGGGGDDEEPDAINQIESELGCLP